MYSATIILRTYKKNPNSPEKANVSSVLTAALYHQLNDEGGYRTGMIGVFTQHYAGNHASGVNWDQYNLQNSSFATYMTYAYTRHLRDYKYIIEEATKSKSYHYVGVAKIMTGFSLAKRAEIYGDIPWSEALDPKNDTPKYDTETSIYQAAQKLIAEGISDLGKSSVTSLGDGDVMYAGDVDKWKAVAYAMSARYYNVLGDDDKALDAVKESKDAGFSSANTFKLPYDGTDTKSRWYWMWENNAVIASKLFMDYLIKEQDPRKEAFFTSKAEGNDNVGYKGKPNGYGASNVSYSPTGPYFAKANSYGIIFPYYELLFIEAEVKFRKGDKAGAS